MDVPTLVGRPQKLEQHQAVFDDLKPSAIPAVGRGRYLLPALAVTGTDREQIYPALTILYVRLGVDCVGIVPATGKHIRNGTNGLCHIAFSANVF
jgi:hypothetical protein